MRYVNKRVKDEDALRIAKKLNTLLIESPVYENPKLKLNDIAVMIEETPHLVSEYLNNNLGKGFSNFINEHRVNKAVNMLKSNDHLTLEAIGQECGFRSNSAFYAAFNLIHGITPAKYKKTIDKTPSSSEL